MDLVARAVIKGECHYANKKGFGDKSINWFTIKKILYKFKDLRIKQKMGRLDHLSKRDVTMLKRQLYH